MNIIFGTEQAEALSEKYTVLELDTFQFGKNGPIVTAYCTVENLPLDEVAKVVEHKTHHQALLHTYQNREWQKSLQLIDQLTGLWGNELDTFYSELQERINKLLQMDPADTWSSVILKESEI